jgi:uncharacterized protein YndB with AHSA1/START domain
MERETTVERTMFVNAGPEVVWKALTDPELTKLYMQGWMGLSSWKPGTSLRWIEKHGADQVEQAQGTVMESLPARRLRYTCYKPSSGLPNEPAIYTTVDITLEVERDGRTRLHLWHGDFAGLPNDVRRAREAGRTWVEALVGLKRVAEEQQDLMAA